MPTRPPFIVHESEVEERTHAYPNSHEQMSPARALGQKAGLLRIGLHLVRVAPGTRTSWPHAEEDEEEFVYVVRGECSCWVDGEVHRVRAGDLIAFPAGTGISHTFFNDGHEDALLLSGGEAGKADSRIYYPLHPQRRADLPWSRWWEDVPVRKLGAHDGLPEKGRK
jgi:uncharacterized cupin superfamily protein